MPNKEDTIIRIRIALKQRGMTQRDLAAALGKKETEVSRWMNGRMGISVQNIQKIEQVLETPISRESLLQQGEGCISIGIIGTGSIATRFAEEIAHVQRTYIHSAYNPDAKELERYCDKFGITNDCHCVEDLLKDVDAVYMASPYLTHYQYAKMALQAGKHVLCETPFTQTYKEAQELYQLAEKKGLKLALALKTAYCPSFVKILESVKMGYIGEVVELTTTTTTLLQHGVDDVFNNERLAENAIYGMLATIKVMGYENKRITHFTKEENGRKMYFDMNVEYEDSIAHVKAGTGVKSESSMVISGTKGYIYVPAPWWKPAYFEIRFENQSDNKKLYFPFEDSGLRYEIKSFIDSINLKPTDEYITKEETLLLARLAEKYLKI